MTADLEREFAHCEERIKAVFTRLRSVISERHAESAREQHAHGRTMHCGCSEHERIEHDDTCRYGCNGDQVEYQAFDVRHIDGTEP